MLASHDHVPAAEEASRLSRRLDWRFLLPDPHLRRVAYVGEPGTTLARALDAFSDDAVVAKVRSAMSGERDLIVAQGAARHQLEAALPRLVSGGWLYWELQPGQAPRNSDLDWLARWGVSQVRTFWNSPGFEDRRWIVPLDHPGGMAMAMKRRFTAAPPALIRKTAEVLSRSRIARRTMSISLIGRRGPAGHPGTFAHRFAESQGLSLNPVSIPWQRPYLVATPAFASSRTVVFLMEPDSSHEATLVAKVARVPGGSDSLGREAESLRAVHFAHGAVEAPKLHAYSLFERHAVVMESAVAGELMQPRTVRRATNACVSAIMAWLEDLHRATRVPATAAPGRVGALIDAPLSRLEPIVAHDSAARQLLLKVRRVTSHLTATGLPLVFEHGDLSSPNLIMQRDGHAGVLDWELANPRGLPAVDLFFFLAFVAFARDRATTPEASVSAFRRAFFGPAAWTRPYIDRYAASVGVPKRALRPLFLLCWSRYLANLPDRMAWAMSRGLGPDELAMVRRDRYWHLWKYAAEHCDEFE